MFPDSGLEKKHCGNRVEGTTKLGLGWGREGSTRESHRRDDIEQGLGEQMILFLLGVWQGRASCYAGFGQHSSWELNLEMGKAW